MAIQRYDMETQLYSPGAIMARAADGDWVDYADHAAFVRDLEDRLRLLGSLACAKCGCAPAWEEWSECEDCWHLPNETKPQFAACAVSKGARALCGRKLLPEPEGGR